MSKKSHLFSFFLRDGRLQPADNAKGKGAPGWRNRGLPVCIYST